MAGRLYLVATPIGNLGDMSKRAIEVLEEADLIAAEDTRNTIRLLNHFSIHTRMTSYHEHNKIEKAKQLCEEMLAGKNIALVTDAGMPAISDPGEELVAEAYACGIEVTIIPGPSAAVSALAISGLPTRRFVFEAFLPMENKERREILEDLKRERRTIILYESPHRIRKTLIQLRDTLGEGRRVSIVRELTKKYEEILRMTLAESVVYFEENEPRGEFVLVVEGKSDSEMQMEARRRWEELSLAEHIQVYEEQGMPQKEAMRMAAKDRGMARRDIYNAMLKENAEKTGKRTGV